MAWSRAPGCGMRNATFLPCIDPELSGESLEGDDGEGVLDPGQALQLFDHALCDVNRLPVRQIVSASHFVTDLTLGLGEVVFDYLAK